MRWSPGFLLVLLGHLPGMAQTWQPAADTTAPPPQFKKSTSVQPRSQLQWLPADLNSTSSSDHPVPQMLGWEPVPPGEEIPPETVTQPPAPLEAGAVALKALPSGPTYANFRALWRDGDWLPQISNTVPVGFGPQGVMLAMTIEGVDCKTGPCTPTSSYSEWKEQFQNQGSGFFWQSIGFGDPNRWLGITITNSTEGFAATAKSGESISLSSGNQTGIHISRALGPDTSIRAGIENLIIWDSRAEYSDNRSAYAVLSQRFRLNAQPDSYFKNLYITLGAGNGEFRSLDQLISAQISTQRAAGCQIFDYVPKESCSDSERFNAVKRAGDYGIFNFIGAAALEITDGLNLITEWSGRNLNAGLSWRPFKDFGLVITPMLQSLLPTCEYGCSISVGDYAQSVPLPENVLTQRVRFSLMGSIEFKF